MSNAGFALIVVALVLIGVGTLLSRRRNELAAAQGVQKRPSRRAPTPPPPVEPDVTHPRPRVVDMHVHGEDATITFDVPFPSDGDEVLADLLMQEALEVVREKRHTLPIDLVRRVQVYAGHGEGKLFVGAHELDTPGALPPRIEIPSMLNLAPFAKDPLEHMEEEPFEVPEVAVSAPEDELGPIGTELKLPKAVDMGLRAQGIDPATMNAIEMVTGLLKLFGYRVSQGPGLGMFLAEKGGARTFILGDPYMVGDHPEVGERTIDRFMADFSMSGCDRGMFVSEKYGALAMYDRERREPRVRFVTRERLQKLVNSLALG